MSHLNKFANQAAYEAGKYDIDIPSVSLITGVGLVYDKTEYIRNSVYIKYTDGTYSAYNDFVSGKTPVGVALKTDACALTIHKSEFLNAIWDIDNELISGITTANPTTALADYNGKENTDAYFRAKSPTRSNAFAHARNHAVYTDGSQGWLPSCGEMEQIKLNATNINAAMALIGGTAISFDTKPYWSSTQASYSPTLAICHDYDAGAYPWSYVTKSTALYCRSVTDF